MCNYIYIQTFFREVLVRDALLCSWQSEKGVCAPSVPHLWSRVFRLRCAVSHLASFHIQGSFGTLLHTKHTKKMHQRFLNQTNLNAVLEGTRGFAHKRCLKCGKTSTAEYWTRNYQERRSCKKWQLELAGLLTLCFEDIINWFPLAEL